MSKQEKLICARLKRNGKLFVFLRKNRHVIFSEEVHQKLLSMYSDYPRGKPIVGPILLAMVSLLQAYEQESDASAVLESMFDQRWQMVLGCLGTEHPIFSQGVLFADDIVITVSGPHSKQGWEKRALQRLQEQIAPLGVELNTEKTKVVNQLKGEAFGFLGYSATSCLDS